MATEMIKFYKGLEASLPAAGVNGALYITTDEGAIYLGTGAGMKRLGDFVQVANVAALPTKAHENCLYYCVAENILAKWNGTEWKQVNKQPTVDELKTLLGLGSMAYKSEVAEGDLNADLAAKINASTAVNHSHANKELLDTYTQTEANLADAVAKKHSHTFNETELNKIAEGDVAKWNGVAADHLTSADKTTLENAIKEAKQAGTDANTNIETYKVTNDARVKAVEDDIAEMTDAEGGILAQAKSYSDGKLATAKTEISAEIDADVKVVNDALEAYKTSNNEALAGVKATAEAAATKAYTDEELDKKVDKVTGKSLVDDSEIAKLAGVSAGANKVEKSDVNGNIKVDGAEVVVYTHPATHTVSEIADFDASVKAYDYATKAEAQAMADGKDEAIAAAKKSGDDAQADVDALEAYVGTFTASEGVDTVVKYIDAKTANIASDERVNAIDNRVKAIEDDYLVEADKTELAGLVTAEKERAEGIEAGLRTDVNTIMGDYLKSSDKTELEGKITAEENRAKGVEESLQTQINTIMSNPDAEGAINSINEFTQYVKDHGTIADGMRVDINKNKEDIATNATAIADETSRATGAEEALSGRIKDLEDNKAGYATTGEVATAKSEAISAAEAKATELDSALKTELQAEIDADVKALADGQVKTNTEAIAANAKAITDGDAAVEAKVTALANNTYTKEQTYTKDEVDAAVATAVEEACSWGSF